MFFWAHDSARLIYPQDSGGTENYLLYGVDPDGRAIAYTPFEKTRVQIVRASHAVPDAILIGLNDRDPPGTTSGGWSWPPASSPRSGATRAATPASPPITTST
jgi:hypothetical protein